LTLILTDRHLLDFSALKAKYESDLEDTRWRYRVELEKVESVAWTEYESNRLSSTHQEVELERQIGKLEEDFKCERREISKDLRESLSIKKDLESLSIKKDDLESMIVELQGRIVDLESENALKDLV